MTFETHGSDVFYDLVYVGVGGTAGKIVHGHSGDNFTPGPFSLVKGYHFHQSVEGVFICVFS